MVSLGFKSVAVLLGGASGEREISLKSGRAVCGALRSVGYEVVEVDVVDARPRIPAGVEAVFVALHGVLGEDGCVQGYLEELGIPYAGTRAVDMPDSFCKVLTKRKLEGLGVPTAEWALVGAGDGCPLGFPVVIKPPREGSSLGVEVVFEEAEWEAALLRALAFDGELLVERYIPGREFTVALLGGRVLPVVEIMAEEGGFDFEAKYVSGCTKYEVPARLCVEERALIRSYSQRVFDAFGCRDLGRVDFRMTSAGAFYMLELNTIPGFTATSLLPKAAAADGFVFEEVCHLVMQAASV